jgi:PAS domain S-box-containing protein
VSSVDVHCQAPPESLLAAIVESSDDAIISKDLNGIITSWNQSAERMFGYRAAEAIGKPISIIAPPDRNEMPEILARIRRGERIDHYETIRQTKDGRRLHVSLTVSPIYDRHGQIIGASKISRDITERKLAEEALAKHAERLARANADLQQFAYITSHDLKEPVRNVTTCAQMLLSKAGEKLNADERELLNYILQGGQRMRQMIADLLPYTRTLDRDLPLAPVSISQVVKWAIDNLHLAIESSQARISCQDSLPTVLGNKVALIQLFQNLLHNAIKYRSAAPLEIVVSAEPNGNVWQFRFQDNGIGIAPTYHKRIFTLFQRLHGSENPGTGVGLSLCRNIVQAHGGKIWVESEEGKGAAFLFTLPRLEEK